MNMSFLSKTPSKKASRDSPRVPMDLWFLVDMIQAQSHLMSRAIIGRPRHIPTIRMMGASEGGIGRLQLLIVTTVLVTTFKSVEGRANCKSTPGEKIGMEWMTWWPSLMRALK